MLALLRCLCLSVLYCSGDKDHDQGEGTQPVTKTVRATARLFQLLHVKTVYMQRTAGDVCRKEVTFINTSKHCTEDTFGSVSSKYSLCTFWCYLCERGGEG